MNRTILKCGILGGIVVFLWGLFSWMVIPLHMMTIHNFDNEDSVAQVIRENTSKHAIYMIPGPNNDEQSFKEKMKEGPFVMAMVKPNGINIDSVGSYIIQLLIQIVSAILITYLLMQCKVMRFMKQVAFVTMIGLIAGLVGVLPGWNWWAFPFCPTILDIVDLIIGWFLAGLVIARLARAK